MDRQSQLKNNLRILIEEIEKERLKYSSHQIINLIAVSKYVSMDDIKAQRLGIYLFHDGTYSLNGIHFFKMSCICEKVVIGSGVRERAIEHSSIPINLFDSMIEGLMINGRYTMKRPSDDELNVSNVKIFFSSSKTSFIHIEAIYDTDNNIIGWCNCCAAGR